MIFPNVEFGMGVFAFAQRLSRGVVLNLRSAAIAFGMECLPSVRL